MGCEQKKTDKNTICEMCEKHPATIEIECVHPNVDTGEDIYMYADVCIHCWSRYEVDERILLDIFTRRLERIESNQDT